jgi:CelD/BcsL family acetyltransferase involved in cellulose biosynthesis
VGGGGTGEARAIDRAHARDVVERQTKPQHWKAITPANGRVSLNWMLRLDRLALGEVDWEALDGLPDRVLGQTREWLSFLAETQGAEPVVAALREDATTVGYFTGLVFRRFGVRILGSPFPGWTTPFIGFNLISVRAGQEPLDALQQFAFADLGCLHVELRNRPPLDTRSVALAWERASEPTLLIDLTPSEDELLASMSSSRRRNIRLSERNGIRVEQATDLGFAEDYYTQLGDVFAKQGLVPTYGVERVRALIRHLLPTGRLLLLRARTEDGRCVATGIYPAFNGLAQFWGGASWRPDQHLRPNEAVMWHAIRYWKDRGVQTLDLGYGADYKRAWGALSEQDFPYLRRTRLRALRGARSLAKDAISLSRRARGAVSSARVKSRA